MADAITTGLAQIASALAAARAPGINNFGGAVQNLQAAGNQAVGSLGPAIDSLSRANAQVMAITQYAWIKNGALAGVNASPSATADDLATALSCLSDMNDWYNQAYRLAKSVAAPAAATRPAAAAAPRQAPAPALVPVHAAALAPAHMPMTGSGMVVTVSTGVIGFALGVRVAGLVLGGPIGLLVGAFGGYELAKKFKL